MFCSIWSMGPDRLFSDRSRVCTPSNPQVQLGHIHTFWFKHDRRCEPLCAVQFAVSERQEQAEQML